jgi:hypothetical protein
MQSARVAGHNIPPLTGLSNTLQKRKDFVHELLRHNPGTFSLDKIRLV